jgi:hypothetical protein
MAFPALTLQRAAFALSGVPCARAQKEISFALVSTQEDCGAGACTGRRSRTAPSNNG